MTVAQLQAVAAYIYALGETSPAVYEQAKNYCWFLIKSWTYPTAEDTANASGLYLYNQGIREAPQMELVESYMLDLVNA